MKNTRSKGVAARVTHSAELPFDLDGVLLVRKVAELGSFAAAARATDRVPSAVTYAVRKLENSLDVQLFSRTGNRADLTPAGHELLDASDQLLRLSDAIAARVRGLGEGWERELRIGVDAAVSFDALAPLIADFDRLQKPTRLRFSHHVLHGSVDALRAGRIDLAIGMPAIRLSSGDTQSAVKAPIVKPLGRLRFVFCVAPTHPLAELHEQGPLSHQQIAAHRVVVLTDPSRQFDDVDLGVIAGQDTMTVATLEQKIAAQINGLGVGYLPEPFARTALEAGTLIALRLNEPRADLHLAYAWHDGPGRARDWWLSKLSVARVRAALLAGPKETT